MPSALLSAALCLLAALIGGADARWCQVENVKADVHGNFTYAGAWRLDGCTTLALDHGYCAESDCPWRVKFGDEEIIDLADQLHGNSALTALSLSLLFASDIFFSAASSLPYCCSPYACTSGGTAGAAVFADSSDAILSSMAATLAIIAEGSSAHASGGMKPSELPMMPATANWASQAIPTDC